MNRRFHARQRTHNYIVAAYVRRNQIASDQLSMLISTVHQALVGLGKTATETPRERTPAIPTRRSFHHDYIVCLECDWRGKMLRRHLAQTTDSRWTNANRVGSGERVTQVKDAARCASARRFLVLQCPFRARFRQ
jgi:predicted transcriptional regulator